MNNPFEDVKPAETEVESNPFTSVTPTSPIANTIPTETGQQRVVNKLQTMSAQQPAFIKDQNIIDNIAYRESLKRGSLMQEGLVDALNFPVKMLGATQRAIGATLSFIANKKARDKGLSVPEPDIPFSEAIGNAVLAKKGKPYSQESWGSGYQRLTWGAENYPNIRKHMLETYPVSTKVWDFVAGAAMDFATAGYITGAVSLLPTIKASLKLGGTVDKAFEQLAQDSRLIDSMEANLARMNDLKNKVADVNQKHVNLQGLLGTADVLREQKKTLATGTPELQTAGTQLRTVNKVIKGSKPELLADVNALSKSINDTLTNVLDEVLIRKQAVQKMRGAVKIDTSSDQHIASVIDTAISEIEKVKGTKIAKTKVYPKDILYRGQEKKFKGIQTVEGSASDENILLGKGVYTTTSESVAKGYSRGGNVFRIAKPNDKDVFDLTNATPDQLRKLGVSENDITAINNMRSRNIPKDQIENRISTAIVSSNPPPDIKDFGNYYTAAKDQVIGKLKAMGYSWWKHSGGIRLSNGTSHDVYVAISDDAVRLIDESKLRNIYSTENVNRNISSLQSVPTQIAAINKGMNLIDDLDNVLKTQIERAVYIEDIKAMAKPEKKYAQAVKGFETQTEEGATAYQTMLREAKLSGQMNRKQIDRYAKVWSDNKVNKFDELELNDLKAVHDSLKAYDNMKGDLNPIVQFAKSGVFIPDWMAMENMGLHAIHAGTDDALYMIHRYMDSLHKEMNVSTRGYSSLFHKKWGTDQDELLSYFLDQGEKGIVDPAQAKIPPELLSKFTDEQVNYIMGVRSKIKDFTDNTFDMAERLGLVTKDVDTLNNLNTQSSAYADQLVILNNSLKNAERKSPEWYSIRGQIADIKKAKKETDKKIQEYPAIYQENYYPYVKSLKGDIEKNIKGIKAENYRLTHKKPEGVWTSDQPSKGDIYDRYGKGAFRRNIPLQINSPEFMKRLGDESLFSRKATEVVSVAMESELRKIFLEPAIRKGQALIDSLPINEQSTAMHNTFDRIVRKLRNMEMLGDQTLNQWFYGKSKWIEKVTNGRWHSRERAWEHFANTLRQLGMSGTILGNFKVATKNLFQVMHAVPTIGATATYAGWESMFTQGGRRLLGNLPVMIGRIPMEELDMTKAGLWTTINKYGGFANSAIEKYVNCAASGNGAIWKIMTENTAKMDQLGRYAVIKGYDPKSLHGFRFWDIMADAVDDGLFKDVVDAANMNVKFTQWSYHKHDMSPALSSASGKLAFMFQNWTQHYIGAYLPQLWRTLITGKSPITDAMGRTYKLYEFERYALLSHLSLLAGVIYLGSRLGFDMSWLYPTSQVPSGRFAGVNVPFGVPPPAATAVDLSIATLGRLVTGSMTNDSTAIDEATKRLLEYDIPSMIPTGVGVRTGIKVLTGEKEPQTIFMSVPTNKTSYGTGRSRGGRSRSR